MIIDPYSRSTAFVSIYIRNLIRQMAAFISTWWNCLSNGLICPIRLSESTRYIRVYSSQITCMWLVNLRKRLGPLAQPNYQMYSVVITNKNIFLIYISYGTHKYPAERTNIVVINITRYVYLYAFASFSQKNPIKLYSQKSLSRTLLV